MAYRKAYKRFFISDILATGVDQQQDRKEVSAEDELDNNNVRVSPLDALVQMTVNTFSGYKEQQQQKQLSPKSEVDESEDMNDMLMGKHAAALKKRRKSRTAFSNQQIYELEKRFMFQKYLTPTDRDEIAAKLHLTCSQVITWFQNRRAKLKRDIEELKNDMEAAKSLPSSPKQFSPVENLEQTTESLPTRKRSAPDGLDQDDQPPTKQANLDNERKLLHCVDNMVGQVKGVIIKQEESSRDDS